MKKTTLVSVLAAGLALLPAAGALAAAPDPTPNRESKLLVDFENQTTVAGDPNEAGENRASINTDAEFVGEGTKSLKLDLTDVTGWHNNWFVVDLSQPVDISGYQVLSMDVFIPETSIDTSSYYQFDPHLTTTNSLTDDTATTETWYGPVNLHAGWNRLTWTLKKGTDTKISRIAVAGNTGQAYTGPVYVDNIRVYKGSFAGIQPDEKVIKGFDDAADKDAFSGDATVDVNTDQPFVQAGNGSLKIDLTGAASGFSQNFVTADWGTSIDVSNATAIHLDVFVPESSYTPSGDWHELGFKVIGENGEAGGATYGLQNVADQWVTLELPLTPDQAKALGNVKGIAFTRNSGNDWAGPIYIDNLRAVVPTPPATTPPTAGQ